MVLTKFFGSVSREISVNHRDILLIRKTFFDMFEISQTINGSTTKILSTVRQKKTTDNCVIFLWCTKLAITRIQWNLEGFLFKTFWYCDTNNFWQKIVISRLSFKKIFDAQNYLKHRRVRLRKFLRRQQIVLYPPCAQISPIPESSETQKGSPQSLSVQWDKNWL